MSIKHNNEEWLNKICTTLKEGEERPPINGWARLERGFANKQAPRTTIFPMWTRVAVAIAAVVIFLVTGSLTFLNNDAISPVIDGGLQLTNVSDIENTVESDVSEISTEALVKKIVAQQIEREYRESSESKFKTSQVSQKSKVADASSTHAVGENRVVESQTEVDGSLKLEDIVAQEIGESEPQVESVDNKESVKENPRRYTPLPSLPKSQYDLLAVSEDVKPKRAKNFGVSAYVAGGFSQSNTPSASPFTFDAPLLSSSEGAVALPRSYDNYNYNHKQSLSFGVTARKEFSHGLSLETGVVYSLLRSDVTILDGTDPVKQSLHYLGIPLRLNWNFVDRSNFLVYLGVGGMGEKAISAKFDSKSISEKELQWSVFGALGVQYNITKHVGIYFEPKVSHYLTETTLRTARMESDAMFALQFGVRFTY